MEDPFLQGLEKKDSDLIIISATEVETTLPEFQIEEEDKEEIEINLTVPVLIIRHVLLIGIFITFFFAIFGIVPYYLFLESAPIIQWSFLGGSAGLCICGSILMYVYREAGQPIAIVCGISLMAFFLAMCSAASLIGTMAPLQICVTLYIEYTAALLYCLIGNEKQVHPWWVALTMMMSGFCVWSLGLYAFIASQHWIILIALFFVSVGLAPFFTAWHISTVNQYNLQDKELIKATIEFLLGVVVLPGRWMSAKYVTRPTPPSYAPVDDKGFVEPFATGKVGM